MSQKHIIIPARLASSRFPEKLLCVLAGKSILQRAYEQAILAGFDSVHIAVDHDKTFQHAKTFCETVWMTSSAHPSGTSRLAEVVGQLGFAKDSIIVNVQGDEPFMHPSLMQQTAHILESDTSARIATLRAPITDYEEYLNPNVVKVVCKRNEQALYFSRSPIPYWRDGQGIPPDAARHVGVYAYRASFLYDLRDMPDCNLENTEMLEQLRFLWLGESIATRVANAPLTPDINTAEDLEKAKAYLAAQETAL